MTDFSKTVGVAMIHFGDPEETVRSMRSVLSLDPAPGKVLLIDNSRNLQNSFQGEPRVGIYQTDRNYGYAGGVNKACELMTSWGFHYAWILNNDVEVSPEAMLHWQQAIRARPDADIIGSYVADEDQKCWFGGGYFNAKNGAVAHMHMGIPVPLLPRGGTEETDWINGCSMFLPLSAVAHRGTFDEDLFLYKEELEWQVRPPRARAYLVRECLVVHKVGQTTGSSSGRLGTVFMARNGAIMAERQAREYRFRWWLHWAWEFLGRPLSKGRFQAVELALLGLRSRYKSPNAVLDEL